MSDKNRLARLLAGLPATEPPLGFGVREPGFHNALVEGPRIPQMGALSPQNETAFQAFMAFDPNVRDWRNGFLAKYGEPPNIAGDPTFDYRAAFLSGNKPQAYAHDTIPHWDSRGKRPDHATAWMNEFMQRFGVDPNDLQAEQVTPEMQAFMQARIGRWP